MALNATIEVYTIQSIDPIAIIKDKQAALKACESVPQLTDLVQFSTHSILYISGKHYRVIGTEIIIKNWGLSDDDITIVVRAEILPQQE